MKTKAFERTVLIIAVLLLVASVGALAQNSAATTFGGRTQCLFAANYRLKRHNGSV
jgi:hypothetical protein